MGGDRFVRIIFMGTPDFAVPALRALVAAGHELVCAYTQPPRPAGRGKQLQPSPVQREAEALGIPVRHPASLKGADEQAEFAGLNADIGVVAAYGLILPQAILDAPRQGCLNVHASLLPRWRGAAPIQRAMLAGDAETGVCIMRMEAGLDTGAVLAMERTEIDAKTAGELTAGAVGYRRAADGAGAKRSGRLSRSAAAGGRNHLCQPKWTRPRPALDFRPARGRDSTGKCALSRPCPGPGSNIEGERYKVLAAEVVAGTGGWPGQVLDDRLTIACGKHAIRPTRIQRAGKPAMALDEFLRGNAIPAGWYLK